MSECTTILLQPAHDFLVLLDGSSQILTENEAGQPGYQTTLYGLRDLHFNLILIFPFHFHLKFDTIQDYAQVGLHEEHVIPESLDLVSQ